MKLQKLLCAAVLVALLGVVFCGSASARVTVSTAAELKKALETDDEIITIAVSRRIEITDNITVRAQRLMLGQGASLTKGKGSKWRIVGSKTNGFTIDNAAYGDDNFVQLLGNIVVEDGVCLYFWGSNYRRGGVSIGASITVTSGSSLGIYNHPFSPAAGSFTFEKDSSVHVNNNMGTGSFFVDRGVVYTGDKGVSYQDVLDAWEEPSPKHLTAGTYSYDVDWVAFVKTGNDGYPTHAPGNGDPTSSPSGDPASKGNYNSEGRSGNSEADPYIIDSREDLELLRSNVNKSVEPAGKYYRLEANLPAITLFGASIGGKAAPFKGHFDGNNRTITINTMGPLLYGLGFDGLGLFGCVDTDGIAIKNLSISTTTIDTAQTSGLVGILRGGIISNCHVLPGSKIISTPSEGAGASSWAGGIVGTMEGGIIRDCSFAGSVESDLDTGGIVGIVHIESGSGSIINCKILPQAVLTCKKGDVGGIVGLVATNTTAPLSIINCTSDATFISGRYIGGIVGFISSRLATLISLSNNTWKNVDREVGNWDSNTTPSPKPSSKPVEPTASPSQSPRPSSRPNTSPSPSVAPSISPSPDPVPTPPLGGVTVEIPVSDITSRNPRVKPTKDATASKKTSIALESGHELKGTIILSLDDDGAENESVKLEIKVPAWFGIDAGMSNLFALIRKDNGGYAAIGVTAIADNTISFTVPRVGDYFSEAEIAIVQKIQTPTPTSTPRPSSAPRPTKAPESGNSGGGGCSDGFGAITLMALAVFAMRRKG